MKLACVSLLLAIGAFSLAVANNEASPSQPRIHVVKPRGVIIEKQTINVEGKLYCGSVDKPVQGAKVILWSHNTSRFTPLLHPWIWLEFSPSQ
jgi:hypothetical protein